MLRSVPGGRGPALSGLRYLQMRFLLVYKLPALLLLRVPYHERRKYFQRIRPQKEMTLDALVNRINDGWGWAHVALRRDGGGEWTARFEFVIVREGKREVNQPMFRSKQADRALWDLVRWLRGKTLRLQALQAGRDGDPEVVPGNLKVLGVR